MFQKITFIEGNDLHEWYSFLNLGRDNPAAILLFVAEDTPFDYKQIQPLFKKMGNEVFGGVFPEVIYDGSRYKRGVVGCAFRRSVKIDVIKNLGTFSGAFPEDFISEHTGSMLILNDGFANNIPTLIETLYEACGKEMTFIGGGAGSLTQAKRPSLFTGDDFFAGGAIVAAVEDHIAIGISHGCQPIYGPAIASSADKHILKTIDWEPAFQYYRRVIEKDAGIKLNAENFLQNAQSYPFGILKYDKEIVLRVPIEMNPDGSILLGSEIPTNSMLMIMKGHPDKLISAADQATEQAKTSFESKKEMVPTKALVIDCITRALFLRDRFEDELEIIQSKAGKDVFLFGFLSLGEIASTGDKYIELHNKTIVIGMGA